MNNFNRETMSFLETCEFTPSEKTLFSRLEPVVKEVTKSFCLGHFNTGTLLEGKLTANQTIVYGRKIDSINEMLEPCEKFLKNYPLWAKQRKETIGSLRKVETSLINLVTILDQKAHFRFLNLLLNFLKPSGIHREEEKEADIEENINQALTMCALHTNLLRELGACEFYDRMVDSINDLFGDEISNEILKDILQLLKNLPGEEIDNVENIETQLRTCLESILPKIRKLLSNGISITCTILSIFLVLFLSRPQSRAILILNQDLGIRNSAEAKVLKLFAVSRVKGSEFEKMISSEIEEKIAAVDDVAIILEMATIVLDFIDVNDGSLKPGTRLITEIANKLEKDFNSYQKVYEMLEKSSSERLKMHDITNWTAVIIYHIPTGTDSTGIKNAIKPLLRHKSQDCIDLRHLPTKGNNWLVKVPTYYSKTFLKLKSIDIANERCQIMQ